MPEQPFNFQQALMGLLRGANQFVSSPLGGFGINAFMGGEQNRRFDEAVSQQVTPFQNRMTGVLDQFPRAIQGADTLAAQGIGRGNEFFDPASQGQRFNQAISPFAQGLQNLPGQFGSNTQDVQRMFENLRGKQGAGASGIAQGFSDLGQSLSSGFGGINAGFQGRLNTARGLVSGLGGQERRDINRQFDDLQGSQMANLRQRGLGSSTVRSSVAGNLGRERRDALGRLQDQTVRQRLGVEQQFGGEALAAQERGLGAVSQAQLGGLGARERQLGIGAQLGTQQAGALQQSGQFGAGLGLDSLMQGAGLAQGGLNFQNQGMQSLLNNLMGFGQIPINARTSGFNTAANTMPFILPQGNNPAVLQPNI